MVVGLPGFLWWRNRRANCELWWNCGGTVVNHGPELWWETVVGTVVFKTTVPQLQFPPFGGQFGNRSELWWAHHGSGRFVMPGPRCPVCAHPDRGAIESALGEGRSVVELAAEYGLTKTAVYRHVHHIGPGARSDHGLSLRSTTAAAPVPEQLRAWVTLAMRVAEGSDPVLSLHAMREARLTLALLARLTGQLVDRTEVHVALQREREILAMTPEERSVLLDDLRRDLGAVDASGEDVGALNCPERTMPISREIGEGKEHAK